MDQESATGFEPNNQILAAAVERLDALAFQLARDLARVGGPGQPGVRDGYPFEAATLDERREPTAHRLDFRQLGHARHASRRLVPGGQSTTSSSTGRSGGASGASS